MMRRSYSKNECQTTCRASAFVLANLPVEMRFEWTKLRKLGHAVLSTTGVFRFGGA